MNRGVEIEIDVLTESVVEVSTGKIYKTHVSKASLEFLNTIHKKNGWKFNWKIEARLNNRNIFKLTLQHYSVTLGALLFSNNKMVIPEKNAYLLVCKYFAHEKK